MTNILILGAGFGGISAALKLEKKFKNNRDIKITLIDRNNFHLFTPSLYEVATTYGLVQDNFASYLRGSVCVPYGEILKNKKNNFIQAEISNINIKERFIMTNGGARLDFDYLIIALGGETEFYEIPGIQDYAFNFKSINDAIGIFRKISDLQKGILKTLKIGIIGGGFTGVELAAELACCLNKAIKNCGLDKKCSQVHLFQAGPEILEMIGPKPRKIIKKRLEKLGVQIHFNSPVSEVGPDYLKVGETENGKINSFDLIIWAGGVRGPEILQNSGLKLTKKGTVEVNEFLQTKNTDDTLNEKTFAIGDSVYFIDPKTKKPIPATAYVAHGLAEVAAGNIAKHLKNEKLEAYRPFYDVWAAPAGGKWAYFHYNGISVGGFWGYILRQLVDLRYFLRILPLNRALALFFKDLVIFTKND